MPATRGGDEKAHTGLGRAARMCLRNFPGPKARCHLWGYVSVSGQRPANAAPTCSPIQLFLRPALLARSHTRRDVFSVAAFATMAEPRSLRRHTAAGLTAFPIRPFREKVCCPLSRTMVLENYVNGQNLFLHSQSRLPLPPPPLEGGGGMRGEAGEPRCQADPDQGFSSAPPAPPKSRAIGWGPVEVTDPKMAGGDQVSLWEADGGTRGPQLPSVAWWGGHYTSAMAHDGV